MFKLNNFVAEAKKGALIKFDNGIHQFTNSLTKDSKLLSISYGVCCYFVKKSLIAIPGALYFFKNEETKEFIYYSLAGFVGSMFAKSIIIENIPAIGSEIVNNLKAHPIFTASSIAVGYYIYNAEADYNNIDKIEFIGKNDDYWYL